MLLHFSGVKVESTCIRVSTSIEYVPDHVEGDIWGSDFGNYKEVNYLTVKYQFQGKVFFKDLEGVYVSTGFLSSRGIYEGESVDLILFPSDPKNSARVVETWSETIFKSVLILVCTGAIFWGCYGFHKMFKDS